nr:hypothetical protein [Tanacetum cinerariifolium]
MMEKIEGYFLVVMEIRSFEKVLMIEAHKWFSPNLSNKNSRLRVISSRRRKLVIDKGVKWFKYLDEDENMERHRS